MFPTLRQNFGYAAAIIFPGMLLMGELFHVKPGEVLFGTVMMYLAAVAVLMLEDVVPEAAFNYAPQYTEEELLEIDQLFAPKAQITILVQGS